MNSETERIVCRVTPWYHKRRIAMLLMVFGFMIAFIYDWQIRYPRHLEAQTALKDLKAEHGPDKGMEIYQARATEKGWPDKPDEAKNYAYAIKWEQPGFALLTGVAGALMLYFYIRTVRGALTADATSFSTPDGQHVPFASAFRIDRRKWDHKGLAYVYYKDAKGREKRAVIDDLIFGGAAKVLERLEANFKGEVIDLEKKEAPAADGDEAPETKSAPAETSAD